MDQIYTKITDPHIFASILAAIAVIASIMTVAWPYMAVDNLDKRMKSVAQERERIRAREREKLASRANANSRASLRQEPKAYMKSVVDRFKLGDWLGTEQAKAQLMNAGFRGPQAEIGFLFFRLVTPIVLFVLAIFWAFVLNKDSMSAPVQYGAPLAAAFIGIKAPEWYLKNLKSKRQLSMRRALPDALDLLLICVESGMAIEPAFRKVSSEIGATSVELAEEFGLTTAELSYLPDRRSAYENFTARTGLEGVKQISTVLIQAERYGTPLGQALRVVAQESRDSRMMEAEKKAASLPPKLTVPMIIFFLPVLFAVIIAPAIINIMSQQ
ncbi:MAG: type II secretion system F family protein [Hyphomicrobiales bacterium]|nr:type II secretion system F family protein [Hyphomicrobiales bacterium]